MSEEILNKIKYLCKNINKDEWSGPLFYSFEGSIKEPLTFKIILEDILPLDKGSQAYTEYELDDRYLDYLMEDEKRMDWYVGHIHSHNTMAVFFSGTDMAELNDNSPSHNFYLSLIVNNYMDFMAKIAFVAGLEQDYKEIPYYALDEDGKKYVINKSDITLKKEKLFIYDCDVVSSAETVSVDQEFADRVTEIMKPKPVKTYAHETNIYGSAANNYSTPNSNFTGGTWKNGEYIKAQKPIPAINNLQHAKLVNTIKQKVESVNLSDRGKKVKHIASSININDFEDLSEILTPIDNFLIELMKFTTAVEDDENLEDALIALQDLRLDGYSICSSVITNYVPLYDKHFPDATDKEFIDDTYTVIDLLEDELLQFPFINVTVEAIKAMIVEFEKNDTRTTV